MLWGRKVNEIGKGWRKRVGERERVLGIGMKIGRGRKGRWGMRRGKGVKGGEELNKRKE
jgi:hypothetical protein